MRIKTATTLSAAAAATLVICSCSGGITVGSTMATPASTSTTTPTPTPSETSTTGSVAYATPPPGWTPTEPADGVIDPSNSNYAALVDKFKSFRNTMNVVVPKSYGLSDLNLLGVAVWVCARSQAGTTETDIAFQVPGLVQRLDPTAPQWEPGEAVLAVDKAKTIYCPS